MTREREMEFRVLGPLEVRRDGRALALGGAKQRGLLATLLTQPNKSFAVERLAELLWADDAPATADHAIEVYVSQLRRTLEPGGAPYQILVRSHSGYSLQIDPAALDAVQFQRLVEGAKRLSPEPALIELDKALDLWRGPAFADFAGEPFAIGEAGRLAELRLHAIEERNEARLALGQHEALVGELVSLVNEHPLRERLCGQLMVALYRSGRQAEASDVYQRTRERLTDELGMEPGPELQSLLKRILQQDPSLTLTSGESGHAPRPPDQARRQLERSCLYGLLTPVNQLDWRALYPPQESGVLSDNPVIPAYVQRTADHELRTAIRNALSTGSSRERLIVVSGESKAGKTRTLLEALTECCPDSRLIWLRPPDEAEDVPPLSVLADSWDAMPAAATLVVVLDDLQYHCSVRTNAISHSALSAVAQHAGLIIVATCQPSFLRLDPADRGRGVPRGDPEVVRWANERAISLDGQLDPEERARAIDTFAGAIRDQRLTKDSLGRLAETLASVDQLTAKYRSASADPQYAHRAALVDAAADHWVLMPGFAVSIELLVEFAQRHFKDRFPTRGWRSHYTEDAVEWATEPLGHVHALLRDVASEGTPVLRLHDGVAARLAASWDPAAWIPGVREKLPPMALFNVGLFLEGQGRRAQAEVWYQLLSEVEGTSTSARRLIAAYLM
jgi:DNA-binding SARP family transcriptional activator